MKRNKKIAGDAEIEIAMNAVNKATFQKSTPGG
jgi:hypothetical protein